MSWLLETLLGLALAGLMVAGAYEAWQNRRKLACLPHGSIAVATFLVGIFILNTWPWRVLADIVNWLITWLIPHCVMWLFDFVEFLILTVTVEIAKLGWDLLIAAITSWAALPLLIVVGFGAIYLRFAQERDRQRLQNIANTGVPGEFNWNEAVRQVFSVFRTIF